MNDALWRDPSDLQCVYYVVCKLHVVSINTSKRINRKEQPSLNEFTESRRGGLPLISSATAGENGVKSSINTGVINERRAPEWNYGWLSRSEMDSCHFLHLLMTLCSQGIWGEIKCCSLTGRKSLWAAQGLKSFFHSSAFPTEKVMG